MADPTLTRPARGLRTAGRSPSGGDAARPAAAGCPPRTRTGAWIVVVALAVAAADLAGQDDWARELGDLPPGPHTVEVDSVYRISGFSHDDLLREMLRKGPGTDEIGTRFGLHLSQWRYGYEYRSSPGLCRLTEAQVLLRSVIITPEWTNVSTAPQELSRGWRPFVAALRTHEEGHRNRAKALGVFLWQALLGLEASSCDELERRVRDTAESVLADGREAQLAYDRDTGHGSTQGAVWPRP
jgi:predicted secreted Zn-dependent protease